MDGGNRNTQHEVIQEQVLYVNNQLSASLWATRKELGYED
jgi:predicted nucleic acid-binding Zn ribbon protein